MSHDQKPTKMRIVAPAGGRARRADGPVGSDIGLTDGAPPIVPIAAAGGGRAVRLLLVLLFLGGAAAGGVGLSMLRLS